MKKHIFLLQGAGAGAYEEDKLLATSLAQSSGPEYELHYPEMPHEDDAPYAEWKHLIKKELAAMQGPIVLVGHSVGASILMKWLGEMEVEQPLAGLFLLEAPFWGGNGWLYEGYEELMLPENYVTRLPKGLPIFLYHCRDDAVVPFEHLALHVQLLPQATVRKLNKGGHQLNNDLSLVAKDIKSLQL